MSFDSLYQILGQHIENCFSFNKRRKNNNIKVIKNSKKIKRLYDNTIIYSKELYGNNFRAVKNLFRNNDFDSIKNSLDESDYQFYLSKKTLKIWKNVFLDMENVYDDQENWFLWKKAVNSNTLTYSYQKEAELLDREKKDKAKLKKDIRKLKNRKELHA